MPSVKPGILVRFEEPVKAYIEQEAKQWGMTSAEFLRAATANLLMSLEQNEPVIDLLTNEERKEYLRIWLSAMSDFEKTVGQVAYRNAGSPLTNKRISIVNKDIEEALSFMYETYAPLSEFREQLQTDISDSKNGKAVSRWNAFENTNHEPKEIN